jgi:two-component system sensor histidine kinase PilS (NtrC family)
LDSSNSLLRSIPIIRFAVFAVFFILFQGVILLQRPFIQIDFIYTYYSCLAMISAMYFIPYALKIERNPYFSFVEIMTIIVLLKSQPMFSSFFLVMILILLFLAGLESEIVTVIFLVFSSSMLISLGNLFFFKWSGLQNILNMGLFNLAFFAVLFFSTQLKFELRELSESLSQTAMKLKSKAELAQILIEHIPVGLMALDTNQQLVFINKILEDQMKLNRSSMLDLIGLSQKSHLPDISYYNSEIAEKRYYQMENATYFDADMKQTIDLYLVKDTTEFRLLQEQVRHKEKMAAVGQLAAGIAHEIRNPLAGISGSIELLSQDTKNPDDQKLMKIILREIDRLNNLITDFLDYSKPETQPDQKIDLAIILDEVLQNIKLSPSTPEKLRYQIQIQSCYIFRIC